MQGHCFKNGSRPLYDANGQPVSVLDPRCGHPVLLSTSEAVVLIDGEPRSCVFADEESGVALTWTSTTSDHLAVLRGKIEIRAQSLGCGCSGKADV